MGRGILRSSFISLQGRRNGQNQYFDSCHPSKKQRPRTGTVCRWHRQQRIAGEQIKQNEWTHCPFLSRDSVRHLQERHQKRKLNKAKIPSFQCNRPRDPRQSPGENEGGKERQARQLRLADISPTERQKRHSKFKKTE